MPLLLVLAERCDVCVCTCVYVSLFQAVSPASCYTCVNCRDERRGASPLLPVFQERWPSVFLPPALPLSLYFSFHFPFSVFSMLPPLSAPPSFSLSPFIPCSQSPFHFSISMLPFSVFVTPSLAYESVPPSNTDKLSLFPDFLSTLYLFFHIMVFDDICSCFPSPTFILWLHILRVSPAELSLTSSIVVPLSHFSHCH